jgi:hypothetical protein
MKAPENNSVRDDVLSELKNGINALIRTGISSIVLILLFYIPDKWNFLVILIYIFIALFLLMMIFGVAISIWQIMVAYKALNSESESIILSEKIKTNKLNLERKSAIIGNIYAVISKGPQETQIWFTEDSDGWDLMQKFGWWQYKRTKKPFPSQTHDVHLVVRDIPFDSKFQKRLKSDFISDEEKKLRRERYFIDSDKHKLHSIYVINDRLKKSMRVVRVNKTEEDEFIKSNLGDEFITVVKACDGL